MLRVVLSVAFLVSAGCSDPAIPEMTTSSRDDAGVVIDRGAPVAPGGNTEIDPDRMGASPAEVRTRLQSQETRAGATNLVNCDVLDTNGELIVDVTPVVYVEPDRNILRTIDGLSASTPGEYGVFCALPAYGLRDETPEVWRVTPGEATQLLASVNQNVIEAGEILEVTCLGVDEFGNEFPMDDVDFEIQPNNRSNEVLGDGTFRFIRSGAYQVGCSVPGITASNASVTVTSGPLAELDVSLSPLRTAYRINELIETQWSASDAFGNDIESGVQLDMQLPTGGQLVGVSRFSFSIAGMFSVTFIASDSNSTIRKDMVVVVDAGAPLVTCISPTYGAQVVANEGDMQIIRGRVDDELGIEDGQVFIDGLPIAVAADGTFEVAVPVAYGPNAVKITATDNLGTETSRLCGFFAAQSYRPSTDPVTDAIRVRLDQSALDESESMPEYGSLGDVIRAFLNSEGLLEEIDAALLAANPVVPVACRASVLGACAFSMGVIYQRLSVLGPNLSELRWVEGGVEGTFSLQNVTVSAQMSGKFLGAQYTVGQTLSTAYLNGKLRLGIHANGGRLRVTYLDVSDVNIADIVPIYDEPEGIIDSILNRFNSIVVSVTEYFFEERIVEMVSNAVETGTLDYFDTLLGTLGATINSTDITIPELDGQGALTVAWETSIESETRITASEGLLLSAQGRLMTSSRARTAALGAPLALGQPRVFDESEESVGAVIDFSLINHALNVLWEAGYLDLTEDAVSNLGGIDLPGTTIAITLLAPPAISGTQDGRVRIGVGPVEGRGMIPPIGIDELVFRAAVTIEGRVILDGNSALRIDDLAVSDFALAIDGVPIGMSGTTSFENGVRDLLTTVISDLLTTFLPEIPIPSFIMPAEYGRYGVPAGTRLGLVSGSLKVGERDVEAGGDFGELLP